MRRRSYTAGGGSEGGRLVGRKILKRWGDTVISGYVKDYNPPVDGKQESWTLRHEKNFDGGDVEGDNSVGEDEEVDRPELDKRLNLQAVMEREFPSVAKEFTPGVFTGEVVEIKPSGFTGLKGTLWKIDC
ncbi:hypothetical protein Esi_0516_0001 [Ectocarpus siliculosus]|uniref:Uncharacterized protein n=1 Tax=Ectocarpus siliculosus TaxID=2880 RepID=D8LNZ0_ECTSI|nr:hypothetical protein Esi_0516_0001 [Ectocarpus siliculosus]|eukprot:CBN79863.1 hypothetical protein Esi_0516_0001 [Ectocarpus siliculosus]